MSSPPVSSVTSRDNFRTLPPELMQHIYSFLTLTDVGKLAMTSKLMTQKAAEWSNTENFLRRVAMTVKEAENEAENDMIMAWPVTRARGFGSLKYSLSYYREYGLFVKRLTCLNSDAGDRVSRAFATFERALEYIDDNSAGIINHKKNKSWETTYSVARMSALTHVLTRGWDEHKYHDVVEAIDGKFDLRYHLQLIDVAFMSPPVESIMWFRLVFRSFAWDFVGDDDFDAGVSCIWPAETYLVRGDLDGVVHGSKL
jgi:hypothetical protein